MKDISSSFSWRTSLDSTIPVRNQDRLPCSWAFAAAALVSYELKIRYNELWDFEASAQHLIDHCQRESESVHGLPKTRQETLEVLQYIQEHGVSLQTRYPYRARKSLENEIPRGPKIRIREVVPLSRDTTLADIKIILLRHPIIASVEGYWSLLPENFPSGKEDVYVENTGVRLRKPNYLLVMGYGNQYGRDFYEVHNSWGLEWGNYGCGRILCQLVSPFAYVNEAYIDEEPETEKSEESEEEKLQTKDPELMTDNKVVEVEDEEDMDESDDDMSPKVIYDRNSTDDAPRKLFIDLAELAICFFNKNNPHMPYEVVDVVKVTEAPGMLFLYTLMMTAKPKRLHGADADVQTFQAAISDECGPVEEARIHNVKIVDL